MLIKNLIKDNELKKIGSADNFSEKTRTLFNYQIKNFPFLRNCSANFESAEFRNFVSQSSNIIFKYYVNNQSLEHLDNKQTSSPNNCPLCIQNLPTELKVVQYGNDFIIRVNLHPIFEEQIIISKIRHIPQKINRSFEDLLNISKDLGKFYSVYYNSPDCGALITDHLHFNACKKNEIPIEKEYDFLKKENCRLTGNNGKLNVYASTNFNRKFIALESKSKVELLNIFKIFYDGFLKISDNSIEPMLNIISTFDNNKWLILIFPRKKNKVGFEQIIPELDSVNLGGLCFTDRKEIFETATKNDFEKMFEKNSVSTEFFEYLVNRCETYFR